MIRASHCQKETAHKVFLLAEGLPCSCSSLFPGVWFSWNSAGEAVPAACTERGGDFNSFEDLQGGLVGESLMDISFSSLSTVGLALHPVQVEFVLMRSSVVHWSNLLNAKAKACRPDWLGLHSCTPTALSVAIAQVWERHGNKTGADALAASSETGGKVEVDQSIVKLQPLDAKSETPQIKWFGFSIVLSSLLLNGCRKGKSAQLIKALIFNCYVFLDCVFIFSFFSFSWLKSVLHQILGVHK